MSRSFLRDFSLKTFENEQHSTYENNITHQLPNFFTQASEKNENYSEKSFHGYTTEQNQNKNSESLLSRMKFFKEMSLSKNDSRKPLNDLLKSNKDNSVLNSASKGQAKIPKQKAFYKTAITQDNELNFEKLKAITPLKSLAKDHNKTQAIKFININESYDKNLSLNKLRESVKHIKTLQSQLKQSASRSRSAKKKGLNCTLYEKSLEKKVNDSDIKSSKKLITIKKRFQKTETEWSIDNQAPQKEIKKVLLKKKNKEQAILNNMNCFNSVILDKKRTASRDRSQNKQGKASRPKIGQNIRSVSKNKKQAYIELNKSMLKLIQSCKNQQLTLRPRSTSKSIQKQRLSSLKKKQPSHQKNWDQLHTSKPLGKKVIINEKIQSNLNKIHEKYKFILNYLTDFEIIAKLNGYEIAQVEECKWVLLVIDEVYEMIKHSEQTKLKGIQHSREYGMENSRRDD